MPGFIIDLDGTLYAGADPIEGARPFMEAVRAKGWPVLLLTNNSTASPAEVTAKLRRAGGIEAETREVLTSAMAAARYLTERNEGRRVYVVGETGLREALAEAGFTETDHDPDYVVQGIDRAFTYAKLERAVHHIRSGARHIQTNPDHLLPMEGRFIPGAGAIAAAIRTATEAEPIVIGKPSPIIMRYALELLALDPGDTWVIGDNLRTDIGGGLAAGCRTLLALTGHATPDNYEALIGSTGIRPEASASNLFHWFEEMEAGGGFLR